MINARQFAAFVIGALLSANVLSGNCNPALAGPAARSADAPAAAAPAAALPATQPRARVYVFRGALGPIFSRGMDRLTKRRLVVASDQAFEDRQCRRDGRVLEAEEGGHLG